MLPSLKAELRKLLTVRSTYFLTFIALLLSIFISFWVYGYKDESHAATNPSALLECLYGVASVVGVFLSFVAVLLAGHEYRYNTIMYTLTSTNKRTKIFVSKLLAIALLAVAVTVVLVLVGAVLFYFGQQVHNLHAMPQVVHVWPFVWGSAAYVIGSVVFAFMVTMLLRNLIGAIAFILVVPSTLEQLLGLLLKDNVKYLPYTALGNLVTTSNSNNVTHGFSLSVVLGYALVSGFAAWYLFLRRDAN